MRKANKAQLIQYLFGKDYQLVAHAELQDSETSVIDGGALLRKVDWSGKENFRMIIDAYKAYLKNNHGPCMVVFDGYSDQPSTKDHEHTKRAKQKCHNFNIHIETHNTTSQQSFLANRKNKAKLIELLVPEFVSDGHVVSQAEDDADALIVDKMLEYELACK